MKILSILVMPQYIRVNNYWGIMPSIRQQINQSQLPLPKTKISQYNPYESETSCYMNVNEVAMPQYKPSEVTMLQWKYSPSWLCLNISESTTIEGSCLVYVNKSINLYSHCQKWKYLNMIHRNQKPHATWLWMKWLCPSINHLKWLCSKINQSPSPTRGLCLNTCNLLSNRVSKWTIISKINHQWVECLKAKYRVGWLYLQ